MISKERDAFDETDVGDKIRFAVVRISAVADGKRVVDGDAQALNI